MHVLHALAAEGKERPAPGTATFKAINPAARAVVSVNVRIVAVEKHFTFPDLARSAAT